MAPIPSCRAIFLVVILGPLLGGCSLLQLTYNNLNWVIPWYLDSYITLNERQEVLLDQLIRKELHWHRTTQLSHYAGWLRELSQDVEVGFNEEKVTRHLGRFEEFRTALMQETATHAAALLATTTEKQIDELFENFTSYNQKFFETYIGQPPEKLQRNRLERMEDLFADWLGALTKGQRAAIRHWSQQRGSIAPEVLAYRKMWQARLRTILTHRKATVRFTADLRELLVEPHRYSPANYLAKRERNVELGKELFLSIMKESTPSQ